MRYKLPEEEKKKKISITMDKKLNELLEKYLKLIGVNRSKFIEHLIRNKKTPD